jgi:hypothetical protein
MQKDLRYYAERVARHVTLVHNDDSTTQGSVETASKKIQMGRIDDHHAPSDDATFMEDVTALAAFLERMEMDDHPTGDNGRGRIKVRG